MSKPFTDAEAKKLIIQNRTTVSKLNSAVTEVQEYRDAVKSASDAVVTTEVLQILRTIPVEEINRGKRGFRTKALRDSGYTTIADLSMRTVYNIASVYGISEDTAYEIKAVVKDIVAKARRDVKIKISADNKTPEATKLIYSIYKYIKGRPIAENCKKLLNVYQQGIETAAEDVEALAGTFKWLFASKEKKQTGIKAYQTLLTIRDRDFGTKAKQYLTALKSIDLSDVNSVWKDFEKNSVLYFNILEEINPGILGNDDTMYGLPEELAREIQDQCFFPDGLLCILRRYQEWGVKYALHQEKILLGDEMGLGKTIQAIAVMVSLKNTGATHFAVVCPASVLANWCREIQKMSKLSVTKIYGARNYAALNSWIETGGVAVTNYESVAVFKQAESLRFSMLIVDEAHYIKNPYAQRTRNVVSLCSKADRLMFMTGTALENKVDEMISLIKILRPEIAKGVSGMEALSTAPAFRKAIAKVYYRRKRDDVLTELPELIENKEWCTLTPQEEAVYEKAVFDQNFMQCRRVSWNVEDLKYSSKANRLLELVEEAKADGRKVIVFSFFLDTIRKVTQLLGDQCTAPINGSVSSERRQQIIDDFDNAPAGKVLVAQIQSGGTGLNIQSASVVVICEPQFKPSIENQAISRAYRMGQTRNVLVYRLLCEDTVDERITEILEDKQAIFDAFADKSDAAKSMELDDRSFGNIIQEEIERINARKNSMVS